MSRQNFFWPKNIQQKVNFLGGEMLTKKQDIVVRVVVVVEVLSTVYELMGTQFLSN